MQSFIAILEDQSLTPNRIAELVRALKHMATQVKELPLIGVHEQAAK